MRFITKPTSSAEMTVPSRTPTKPWKYTSETVADSATMQQSVMILQLATGLPVFFDTASDSPSPGVGRMFGARYSITPNATMGIDASRYASRAA